MPDQEDVEVGEESSPLTRARTPLRHSLAWPDSTLQTVRGECGRARLTATAKRREAVYRGE